MIQVRDSFQIRFGKIDQAIDLFLRLPKEVPEVFQPAGARIELLSDISGTMYTLREAMHFRSLEAWDESSQALFARPEFQEWFKDWKQFVEDGNREFFHVEHDKGGWSGKGAVVVRSCFRALPWRVHDAVDLLKDHGAMLADSGVGQRGRVLTEARGAIGCPSSPSRPPIPSCAPSSSACSRPVDIPTSSTRLPGGPKMSSSMGTMSRSRGRRPFDERRTRSSNPASASTPRATPGPSRGPFWRARRCTRTPSGKSSGSRWSAGRKASSVG